MSKTIDERVVSMQFDNKKFEAKVAFADALSGVKDWSYYVANIDVQTRPYPGIQALLSKLQGKGLKLAVASNKFQEGAEKLVKEFFPDMRFVAVLGNSPELPLKPDAAVVQLVLDKAGVSREEAVFVGDSATDMKTAANGGVRSIGVSWGFRPRTDLEQSGAMDIADSAEQLFEKI